MNATLEQLRSRKSVRVFTDDPIASEEKTAILQAAAEAPTPGNQQLYTILDIVSPAVKGALAELCDHQPFIEKAPLVLVFLADLKKWQDAYQAEGCETRRPDVGDLQLACVDAVIAAQNTVVAAESLGIGSCYIGDITERYEDLRELLSLPDYVFPAAMLVYGYPTEQQKQRPKPPRSPMDSIVMRDSYHCMDREELRRMLLPKAGDRPYTEWLQAFCKRKYNSDFSREMSRSVRVMLDTLQKP